MTAYCSNLKGLWDELLSYKDLPICTCGSSKKSEEQGQRGEVMQFLVDLNDSYHAIHVQILLIQPLPTIGKIHSMILQEEKQCDYVISSEVFLADTQRTNKGSNSSNESYIVANAMEITIQLIDVSIYMASLLITNFTRERKYEIN